MQFVKVDVERFSQHLPRLLDVYGPSLRLLLPLCNQDEDRLETQIARHMTDIKDHLRSLSADNRLEHLFSDAKALSEEFSHTLVLIYGVPSGKLLSDLLHHRIRSPLILRLVLQLLQSKDLGKLRSMYHLFQASSRLSVPRGWAFEVLAHEIICQMTVLSIYPVTKQGGWLKRANNCAPTTISTGQRTLSIYTAGSRLETTTSSDCYYVPAEGKNPTFDSFIPGDPGDDCIAFQIFSGRSRTFKAVGANMVRQRLRASDEDRDWIRNKMKFVFVVSKGHDFKVEAWGCKLKDMDFWVLELDIDPIQCISCLSFF